MKKWLILLILLLVPVSLEAKCVNTATYQLKGYLENTSNDPETGRTLSQILFDIFYDDGTSSIGNASTAEMGQGWYRYSYTSNAKNGVWIVRDSTDVVKNFPGGILEQLCDSQVSSYNSSGHVGINLNDITQATGPTTLTNITVPTVDALGAQAKADVNAEVDSALNTAIPVTPTADSVNERVKAMDDKLPTNYIMGSAVLTDKDDDIDGVKTKTDYLPSVTAGAAGGVFIAGTNAATSVTTALTANVQGNLSGSVNSVTTGVTLAADAITPAKIENGALGSATETYLVTGTEGAGTSTQTLIYTTLSVVSTKKYSGMCLWAASNDERRLIISVGNGVFTVRGFSVAPTDTTELRIYPGGCN